MIRRMQRADIDRVAKIWLASNISAHAFIPAEYWKGHYAQVKEMISQAEVYVWEDEAGIRGFVGMSGEYIAGIFVCEEVRSRGIGKELLDFAKKIRRSLMLHVYAKNERAVRFYERESFAVLSVQTEETTGEKEYTMAWQEQNFRKAQLKDVPAVGAIYEKLHRLEEKGEICIGWLAGIYPTEQTARAAQESGELFLFEEDGKILASAVINQKQVAEYADGDWKIEAKAQEVLVLHTLVVDPEAEKQGIGSRFVAFYEAMAAKLGCRALRMDTNAKNKRARALYKKLGYHEVGIVPCVFNGIPDVQLVLLEKGIGEAEL